MATLEIALGSQNGATVLSTDLNALANNAASALSAAIANQTNGDIEGRFELNVTFGTAPTADSVVEVYLVPALDATNYADYSPTGPIVDQATWAGSFTLRAVTTAQRRVTRPCALPPTPFKIGVVNKSGQAFPASGSTVKLTTTVYSVV